MSDNLSVYEQQVGQMDMAVFKNRTEMGKAAGIKIVNKMKGLLTKRPEIRMVFAAAPSQNEVLEYLADAKGIDWSRVSVFQMDEYIGLQKHAPQRFGHFLSKKLFEKVNPKHVYLIDSLNSVEGECKRYGELVKEHPIDIVCLGIGENGHIAFNDPSVADFNDNQNIKYVSLDHQSRQQQVNDGNFQSLKKVPKKALTLTIPTLLSGKYLYCVVPGHSKYHAVQRVLHGPVSTNCPASILKTHTHCRLYLDSESYGEK